MKIDLNKYIDSELYVMSDGNKNHIYKLRISKNNNILKVEYLPSYRIDDGKLVELNNINFSEVIENYTTWYISDETKKLNRNLKINKLLNEI